MKRNKKVKSVTRRPLPSACFIAGCGNPPFAGGLCSMHYQRARPRKDGTVPTVEEIALGPRPVMSLKQVAGRVDEKTFELLERGVELGLGSSIHDLVSRIIARFDPEEFQKKNVA